MTATLALGARPIRLSDLEPLVRDARSFRVSLAASARDRIRRSRRAVERHLEAGDTVYGVTTGFGRLAKVRVETKDLKQLQRNLLLSHACGVGEPLSELETRVALLLRIHTLSQGLSGVRLELVEALTDLFNAGVIPVVPQQGSVGASGDLAPLSHLALTVIGEGEAFYRGKRMHSAKALKAAGLKPMELHAKEGLALINGTPIMTAVGALVALRARVVSRSADAIAALSVEALKGSIVPFDARIAKARTHPGHAKTAANMSKCLSASEVIPSHEHCDKVQDPYCLRCIPQVHGASKDLLDFATGVLEREMNAVTDNPLVFENGDVVSQGNFHGQPVSTAMDALGIGIASWGTISERRIEQLVNPALSGLPAFLVESSGLNSGFMIPQVVAASLVNENKVYAHPASVDTIPTSANQEDHVSMGVTAARKARTIVGNVEWVLAIEAIAAAQGREFFREKRAGRGAEAVYQCVRTRVKPLKQDRYLHPDLVAARDLIASRAIELHVTKATGELEA